MAKSRVLRTSFSKGELSPEIEARPDLAAYFEGGGIIENWLLLKTSGTTRRFGSRMIAEVKDSSKDTIIIPFKPNIDSSYIIEMGEGYTRFYKNTKEQLQSGGIPVELISPYTEDQLRDIHIAQSVDVAYLFQQTTPQHRLSRLTDTSWSLLPITYNPPPSFIDDTDISAGSTLTPGATTGTSVIFTASAAVFLKGDIGRIIVFGSSRAVITDFGASAADTATPNDQVRADILDDFPDTNPIPSGQWLLRLAPQVTLDPDKKEPEKAIVTLVAGENAFRVADVGKFITIYAGLIRITTFTDAKNIKGELLSVMTGTDSANPAAAPAGAWTLEVASWSDINGYPSTGEFYQGRLAQAATLEQLTAFWLSASDDFENYATGVEPNKAIEYEMATKELNRIQWMADNIDLFVGTAGSEHQIKGGRDDTPLGGDQVPLVNKLTNYGSAHIQPIVISRRVIYVDFSKTQVFVQAFNLEEDGFDGLELTAAAGHIAGSGFRDGPIAFQKRRDPRIYFPREDGQLATLTYFHHEKVVGFTRIVTDGEIRSVAVASGGKDDQVWLVVKRNINGVNKQFIEVIDAVENLQTDCAKLFDVVDTNVFTDMGHLEGKTVDVIANGSFKGQYPVVAGVVTIQDRVTGSVEIGLHYKSTLRTMRPAVEGAIIEGLPRNWIKLGVRLLNTIGGKINGQPIEYSPGALDTLTPFTGDKDIMNYGIYDRDGRIEIVQDEPYPITVLCIYGELDLGDQT